MITDNNLKAAENIVAGASYANRKLSPLDGTPLSRLVGALGGFNDTGNDDEIKLQSDAATSSEGSHHSIVVETKYMATRVISNIIKNARNVINPYCRTIIELVEEKKKDNIAANAARQATVKQVELAPVLEDEMFFQIVGVFKEHTSVPFNSIFSTLDSMRDYWSSDEINELIRTGSSLLDNKMAEYLSGVIEEGIFLEKAVDYKEAGLRINILYFMILTGILNGRLDKAQAITENSSHMADLANLRAGIGRKITASIEQFLTSLRNGSILARGSFIDNLDGFNTIHVVGRNYRNWIKNKGGTPEAVLGYQIAHGDNFTTVNHERLKNKPDFYAKKYKVSLDHANSIQRMENIKLVPNTINEFLSDIIRKSDDNDIEKQSMQALLKEALTVEYYGDTEIDSYVRNTVCKVFSSGADVKLILVEIDSALSHMEVPNMDQAVYQATARVIGFWIAKQISVLKLT